MKTTLEIPDAVFGRPKPRRRNKAFPYAKFVTEAVEAKLNAPPEDKPWMKRGRS